MRFTNKLRKLTCLFLLLDACIVVQVSAGTLNDAVHSAYSEHVQEIPHVLAKNMYEAQSHAINQVQLRREIAGKVAHVYVGVYFARRAQQIAESRFKFASEQSELEQQRFEEGLTTLSNLERVRAYKLESEKRFIAASRDVESLEREFSTEVGTPTPQHLTAFNIGSELSSLRHVSEGVSLSHPKLMWHAYRIKNARIKHERRQSKKGYSKKLAELEARGLENEAQFDEALQVIILEAEGMYKNYIWYRKEIEIEQKKILTTKRLFAAVLEARKHQLKNTPDGRISCI